MDPLHNTRWCQQNIIFYCNLSTGAIAYLHENAIRVVVPYFGLQYIMSFHTEVFLYGKHPEIMILCNLIHQAIL